MIRRNYLLLQGLIKYTPTEIVAYKADQNKALQKTSTFDFSKYRDAKEVRFDQDKIEKLKKEMEETRKYSVY